jgi:hypothetical protein
MKESQPDKDKSQAQVQEIHAGDSGQPAITCEASLSDLTTMQVLKQTLIASHNDPAALHMHGTVELFDSMSPRDGVEAMLISQMLTVHSTALTQLNKANSAFSSKQADAHRHMALKLMNLLTKQALAFRKYRAGGDQHIKVEHVSIEKAAIGRFNKS